MSRAVAGGAAFLGAAPSLTVPDVLAAHDFYRDVLGFQSHSADEWFALLSRDGFRILLWQGPASPNGAWDACFWVSDVDALHWEFGERGVTISRAPETMPYGLREMSVVDNHGYRVTFIQQVG